MHYISSVCSDYLLYLGCHVSVKSFILEVVESLLCLAVSICRGSSRAWREASVVIAIMDSHRQVALCVTTGTWTRVQLTYGTYKDPLLACVKVSMFTVLNGFALFSFSTVNTDTETAVVNVTYGTKEEAKV